MKSHHLTPSLVVLHLIVSCYCVLDDPEEPPRPLKMMASIWTRQPNNDQDTTSANPQTKTMVIYLHGNASARVEVLPSLSFLLSSGVYGVCSIDFTGSGQSDGDYVSLGYYERYDLECILQYLQQTYGSGLEIVLWGRSMGASTALMHASEQSREVMALRQQQQQQQQQQEHNRSSGTNYWEGRPDPNSSNAILKGLICDSPFASLPQLCEELVEKARAQGIMVPGIVVSVAIALIARSVSKMAHFSIREIAPVDHVSTIDTPALVVGADDDFIPPHHSEDLCAAYRRGISTNLLMVPGGHNDARPMIVYDAIGQFLQFRLSLTGSMMLPVPDVMLDSYHQRPPWAYSSYGHSVFKVLSQKRSSSSLSVSSSSVADNAIDATDVAEEFGMTKERQDDIQNKLHLMLGQGEGGSDSGEQQQTQQQVQSSVRTLQNPQSATSSRSARNGNQVAAMGVPMVATGVPMTHNPPSSMKSQLGEEINLIDFADAVSSTEPSTNTTSQADGDLLNLDDFDSAAS